MIVPATGPDVKLSGEMFNNSYSGVPPWDIGRVQPQFAKIFDAGEVQGSVLDCGCGTGEHAIELAKRGHAVLGIDFAPAAIEKALVKARGRNSSARFKVFDATELEKLEETFDTAIDSGLFHCFSDECRAKYVRGLTAVVKPGGRMILMCFNEKETRPGPRRVTRQELHDAFATGWTFEYIRESRFDSHIHEGGAQAWVASLNRDRQGAARSD